MPRRHALPPQGRLGEGRSLALYPAHWNESLASGPTRRDASPKPPGQAHGSTLAGWPGVLFSFFPSWSRLVATAWMGPFPPTDLPAGAVGQPVQPALSAAWAVRGPAELAARPAPKERGGQRAQGGPGFGWRESRATPGVAVDTCDGLYVARHYTTHRPLPPPHRRFTISGRWEKQYRICR